MRGNLPLSALEMARLHLPIWARDGSNRIECKCMNAIVRLTFPQSRVFGNYAVVSENPVFRAVRQPLLFWVLGGGWLRAFEDYLLGPQRFQLAHPTHPHWVETNQFWF
jgi:hypothetical protein